MPRAINAAGLAIIKSFEAPNGPDLKAYVCPAGKLTIGYGHTGDVKPGQTINAHQAEAILSVDVDTAERTVANAVKTALSDNQFSALVSFAFNVGPGAKGIKDGFVMLSSGEPSTILKKLNAGDFAGAAEELPKWNRGGGQILAGLTRRRTAERQLFLTP